MSLVEKAEGIVKAVKQIREDLEKLRVSLKIGDLESKMRSSLNLGNYNDSLNYAREVYELSYKRYETEKEPKDKEDLRVKLDHYSRIIDELSCILNFGGKN